MNIKMEEVRNKWKLFRLVNDNNMQVSVLNFGGIITQILVPDKHGNIENVVLGYKDIKKYEMDNNFFGAIIGRVAGRIVNSSFQIDDQTYNVNANEGLHHLHGGSKGFHQVIWNVEPFQTIDSVGLTLNHESMDGEEGYPGNLQVTITYTLTNANQFSIDYHAISSKRTALSMTNHTYFNLSGDLKQTINNHHITINSDQFSELDTELIPTGNKLKVDNTPFDFRNGLKLEVGINSDFKQNKLVGNGYDHYFLFNHTKKENVIVKEDSSGRILTITTNQPGMVMYTANSLQKGLQLAERLSTEYLGVCFETQGTPASLLHNNFPSIILEADKPYYKQTTFTFRL